MRTFLYFLLLFPLSSVAFGVSPEIEKKIEAAFGVIERDAEGTIIGIDLARERVSANNEVLRAALSIPHLKRFRFAGGNIDAESLSGLSKQHLLEELYLQDVPIRDAQWKPLLTLPKLTRLTLRRLPHLTAAELGALPQRLPALRNLALIEVELTGAALAEIAKSEVLTALDVRNCGRLTAGDYRSLAAMPRLADLKIGGFGVTDEVLSVIVSLRFLRGLTIDDALITTGGFETFVTHFASADTLETLVLSRNSALFDNALRPLKKFPNLKRLTVNGMMVTGSFLGHLAEEEATRPKLHRLSLRRAFVSAEGMTALKKYPELRILDLSGAALTPEMAVILATLTHLEELDITDTGIDQESLQRLIFLSINGDE